MGPACLFALTRVNSRLRKLSHSSLEIKESETQYKYSGRIVFMGDRYKSEKMAHFQVHVVNLNERIWLPIGATKIAALYWKLIDKYVTNHKTSRSNWFWKALKILFEWDVAFLRTVVSKSDEFQVHFCIFVIYSLRGYTMVRVVSRSF